MWWVANLVARSEKRRVNKCHFFVVLMMFASKRSESAEGTASISPG